MPFLKKQHKQSRHLLLTLLFILFLMGTLVQNATARTGYTAKISDSIRNLTDSLKISRLIRLGAQLQKQGNPKNREYFEQAINLAQQKGLLLQVAEILNRQGVRERYASNYALSLSLHIRSLNIAKKLNDTGLLSITYNNIGVTYRRIDNYLKALDNHLKALKLAESIHDSLEMAMAINSIGNIELLIGNADESLNYFKRSLKLEHSRKNLIGVAINLNNIGHVYQEKGELQKALHYYKLSLNINQNLGSERGIAICSSDIADVYMKMGQYKLALPAVFKAIKLTKQNNDNNNLAYSYVKAGQLYTRLKDFPEAMKYLNSAIKLSLKINSKSSLYEAYGTLFNIYKQLGNYKKAVEYLQLEQQYHDSLLNINIQKEIARLQLKFEVERDKNQIAMLRQKNQLANQKAIAATLIRKKQQYLMYFFLSAFVLTLVVLTFGSFYLISKNKVNKILIAKNQEIEKARLALEKNAQELIAAKEKAEENAKAKSRFMANISHEIRTPLNAVIGYSDLLSSIITEPTQKAYLASVQSGSKSLLNLMNDILDLSKIETGKFVIQFKEISLHELINDVKNIFTLKAVNKGLQLNFEINEAVPEIILFDETRLRQILLNLVGNAIKFTDEGEVTIRINAEAETQPGKNKLTIQVKDTGSGIPEKEQQIIFEPFHQGYTSQNHEGTGLGLSITKRLASAMGGRITVNSEPGSGSTFTLYFEHVSSVQSKSDTPRRVHFKNRLVKVKNILFLSQSHPAKEEIVHLFKDAGYHIIDVGVNLNKTRKLIEQSQGIVLCCLEESTIKNTLKAIENEYLTGLETKLIINPAIKKTVLRHDFFEIKLAGPLDESISKINTFITSSIEKDLAQHLFERDLLLDTKDAKDVFEKIYVSEFLKAKNSRLFNEIGHFAQTVKNAAKDYQMNILLDFSNQLIENINKFDIDAINQQVNLFERAYHHSFTAN